MLTDPDMRTNAAVIDNRHDCNAQPKRKDVIIEIQTQSNKNALAWIRIPLAWLAET